MKATTNWDTLGYVLATRGIPSDVDERYSGDYDADPWRPPPRSLVVRVTLTPEDAGRLADMVSDTESGEARWFCEAHQSISRRNNRYLCVLAQYGNGDPVAMQYPCRMMRSFLRTSTKARRMSDQTYEAQIAQRLEDLATFFEPRWYRPIKRWRWKRHGTAIAADALASSLRGSADPIVILVEQVRDPIEGTTE